MAAGVTGSFSRPEEVDSGEIGEALLNRYRVS